MRALGIGRVFRDAERESGRYRSFRRYYRIYIFSSNLQDGLGGRAERGARCARDALMQHRTEILNRAQPERASFGPSL